MVKFIVKWYLRKVLKRLNENVELLTSKLDTDEEKEAMHDLMIMTRHRDYVQYVIGNVLE